MQYSVAMLSVHTSPLDMPGRTKDAGGMNIYIRELASELGQRQVSVDIFTRWTDPFTPRIVHLSPNVRVISIKAGPLSSLHKHDLYSYLPLFAQRIEEFRRIESVQYDIIHTHYWLSAIAGMQLAQRWHLPHVTMFHTIGRLKQLAHPNEPEPPLRLDMEQRIMQHADSIIVATDDERSQIIRYCGATPGQVEVIPCGVNLKLFAPQNRQHARKKLGLPQHEPALLFVGRLDPFKGPDVFLRAVAMMEQATQAIIVGGKREGDSDLDRLRALAAELDITSRVHFLGARPQHELPGIYSAADVTVVPSYHESFGLVAVESLACGTPVVATRAGGLMSIVQHGQNGYLAPRCPGFFAERLDYLLREPGLLAQMRAAARPSVLHFNWSHVADEILEVYDMLGEISGMIAQ